MEGICARCKRLVPENKLTQAVDGKNYCDTCFIDKGFAVCDVCGLPCNESELKQVISSTGIDNCCPQCTEKYAKL